MKHVMKIKPEGAMYGLASEIVYWQKDYWCNASARQLKMSFMKPRHFFDYDPRGTYPLIVFLCGGGYQKCDRNVWIPNLVYFAEHGYAVASVEYSTFAYTEHPEQIQEVKAAIRFLRANADIFNIEKDHIAIMGESAGAYLACLCAMSNGVKEYEKGPYPEESSDVQAAVSLYTPVGGKPKAEGKTFDPIRVRTDNFPSLVELASGKVPPFCLFHGTDDVQLSCQGSIDIYEQLTAAGNDAELYLIEGAGHADRLFVEKEAKAEMLKFLDRVFGR